MFNCSIKFIEGSDAKRTYDFEIDIMSEKWKREKVQELMFTQREEQIADVLLDQEIFAGVGNIIKNEVLSLVKINPKTLVSCLSK